jgi:hypothetical protein
MGSQRDPAPAGVDPATPGGAGNPPPRARRLSPWLAVLGLVSLSYLLGAAVMFFRLPSSDFLDRAFTGARAWNERREAIARISDESPVSAGRAKIDKPDRTFDGFTLCSFASLSAPSSRAVLLNMAGEEVHRWAAPFSRVWPRPEHLRRPVHDALVCFFGCHLYPNGDLLVVFHGLENSATNGYGLAKLDKDSNVVWKYDGTVHHDVDVGEDGRVYAVESRVIDKPPAGLESLPTPAAVDYLLVLSPEGKRVREPIPILEALRDSPYAPVLASVARPELHGTAERAADVMHTNSVQVLTRALAPKFPAFRAGQVLVSLREPHALAVLDPLTGSAIWAATGPWRRQHDAQFLDNGRLLLFDNLGPPRGSRVLEYDPQTQAFPWSYSGENGGLFLSTERGMCQRLPNGNTLVVNSQGCELWEVTREKEVVWSRSFGTFICTARRYGPDRLPFLKPTSPR